MPVTTASAYKGVEVVIEIVEVKSGGYGGTRKTTLFTAPSLNLTKSAFRDLTRAIDEVLKKQDEQAQREAEAKAKAAEHGETSVTKVVRAKVGPKPKKPEPISEFDGRTIRLWSRWGGDSVTVTGFKDTARDNTLVYYRKGNSSDSTLPGNLLLMNDQEAVEYGEAAKARDEARKAYDNSRMLLDESFEMNGDKVRCRWLTKRSQGGSGPIDVAVDLPWGFHPDMPDDPTVVVEVDGRYWPMGDTPYNRFDHDAKRALRAHAGIADAPDDGHNYVREQDLADLGVLWQEYAAAKDRSNSLYRAANARFFEVFVEYRRKTARYRDDLEAWEDAKAGVLS